MKALFLSPHLDDAVFSCGGTMAKLAARGDTVILATVFTGSVPSPRGFALACQLDKGLSPDVDYMARRRLEDEHAAQILGARHVVHLGALEAPHRGYESAAALFEPVLPTDRGELPVGELLQTLAPDCVFVPQALGGHVDHVRVLRAFLACYWRGLTRFYRDVPYVLREPGALPTTELGAEYVEALAPFDLDQKVCAAEAYGTQTGFQFGGRLREALTELAAREGSSSGVPWAERMLERQ